MCVRERVCACVCNRVYVCTRSKKKLTYVTQYDVSGVLVVALRDGDREIQTERGTESNSDTDGTIETRDIGTEISQTKRHQDRDTFVRVNAQLQRTARGW
jgi:hypothetical protein